MRVAARGEIQALIDSPELRRIFDEEPGAASPGRAARSIAHRRDAVRPDAAEPSEDPDLSRPEAPRSSRRRRILVGLAPFYLAGVILFFEAVREPSTLLQVFGTPSVAEEPAPPTGRMNLATAAPAEMLEQEVAQPEIRQANASEEDARAASLESWETAGAASTGVAPAEVEDPLNEEPPAPLIEKKATDLAKRAADQMEAEVAAGADALPEAALDASTVALVDDRPFADPVYPDLHAGTAPAEPIDPAAAEAAEEALRLSRGDRREVQRRLRFADADPEMIDGIFGPATRSAIAIWQEKAGLPATGFLDETAMAMLVEETAAEFRAWRAAERARAREQEEQSAVVASSAPPFSPVSRDDGCRRLPSGEIAFGQDVGCNFRAFGNNFKRDFKDLKGNLRQLFD